MVIKTETKIKKSAPKKYLETVGRRKTATARVRLTEDSKNSYVINGLKLAEYFPVADSQAVIKEAFEMSKTDKKFLVSVLVKGGGMSAKAEAIRHGISRGLVLLDAELRKSLKKAGFLKRDPRMKERKKFGLKKARRAPQWNKR